MSKIKILLVEDEIHQSEALEEQLLAIDGVERVKFTANPSDALRKLTRDQYAVALVDVYFGQDRQIGLDLIAAMHKKDPDCEILAMSFDPSAQEEALHAGAIGFLEKPFSTTWTRAIRNVIRSSPIKGGDKYRSPIGLGLMDVAVVATVFVVIFLIVGYQASILQLQSLLAVAGITLVAWIAILAYLMSARGHISRSITGKLMKNIIELIRSIFPNGKSGK